jgi:hypothetical protein
MSGSHYPRWQELAHDYLAVMAPSVSSKQAFSLAGITISKRHNQLDGNIVEALQCLKLLPQNFSSQVVPNILEEETLMDSADLQPANQEGSASEIVEGAEEWTWEEVIAEEGLAGSDNAGNNDDFEMVM